MHPQIVSRCPAGAHLVLLIASTPGMRHLVFLTIAGAISGSQLSGGIKRPLPVWFAGQWRKQEPGGSRVRGKTFCVAS